jgi:hypothetical protein
MTTNFFSPLSFVAVFGSGIRDPGWVKIRIRDKHPGSATLLNLKALVENIAIISKNSTMRYRCIQILRNGMTAFFLSVRMDAIQSPPPPSPTPTT